MFHSHLVRLCYHLTSKKDHLKIYDHQVLLYLLYNGSKEKEI